MARARRSVGGGDWKTKEKKGNERRRLRLNSVAQKHKETTQEPSPRQRDAEDGHDRDWKPKEGHRR